MNRTGLIVALGFAVVVGVLFGFYPQLDLRIAQPFHDVVGANRNLFAWRLYGLLARVRDAGLWIPGLGLAVPVVAVLLKLILPRRRMLVSGRAALFLMATMTLGPGLVVNVALKEHWGRPRPAQVSAMGGDYPFVAWWDPRGDCPSNCSFVSGDVSSAAWTFAPAALAPPAWRALAYTGALAFTLGMAALRIAVGAHFFTDAAFAGIFTFLIVWLAHGLIYRWPRMRLREGATEQALERLALPVHDCLAGLLRTRKPQP
jgi:membrane-associated PAP2 superfamily phosphatase